LISESGVAQRHAGSDATVGTAFDAAFAKIRRAGIRNEYVYRSALTHNVLLGRHSLNSACMLTEFRTGSCKADLAILNGTATVYEIKSDRDSLSRLENQVVNYQKVFPKAYVIAGEGHLQDVLAATPREVGVMSLARWNRVQVVREAVERTDLLCPATIFDSLRAGEARVILENLGLEVPTVPNTMLRSAMRERFELISPEDAHIQMVRVLKQSRSLLGLATFVRQLPPSLQPAALSIRIRASEHLRIVEAINTPLEQAIAWA
jgi:hypothetical protein